MYELYVNRAIYGLETQKTLTTQLEQFEFDLRWKKVERYDLLCVWFITIENFIDELKYLIQMKHCR
jgi:hypothetical protein